MRAPQKITSPLALQNLLKKKGLLGLSISITVGMSEKLNVYSLPKLMWDLEVRSCCLGDEIHDLINL